jgi:hypothetical protein
MFQSLQDHLQVEIIYVRILLIAEGIKIHYAVNIVKIDINILRLKLKNLKQ